MVKKSLSKIYLLLILLFIYTPILVLVVYSFTDTVIIGQWNGFSFNLYLKLFKDNTLMTIVRNTLILAVSASALATILGTLGAIGIFYSKKKTAKFIGGISNIPLINAEIVTAVSIALLFALLLGGKSMFSLIIGHIVICVPFVVLSVIPKLKQMDNNLYEAALDLGATPTKALFKIILPEIIPGIISGFMLSITLSLDDYIVTAFTKPNTFETISTYVYNAVKNQQNSSLPALRALSAIIFILMIIIVIIFNINISKNKQRSF